MLPFGEVTNSAIIKGGFVNYEAIRRDKPKYAEMRSVHGQESEHIKLYRKNGKETTLGVKFGN